MDSKMIISLKQITKTCRLQIKLLLFWKNLESSYIFSNLWNFLKKNSKLFNTL